MPMTIQAAVIGSKGSSFDIEELELADPLPHEILVKMVATGICHSDINARDQFRPFPLPMVFGHEGAGIVTAVGSDVTTISVGDHVILTRLTCGECPACRKGTSNLCSRQALLNFAGRRADGSTGLHRNGAEINGQFFGQSSFASHALANARNATKIDSDFDLTVAPAFGCGVLTGTGAVLNGLRTSLGASIAVFGAGAVGLSSIMAARAGGCATIIAVDRQQSRLDLARELGATHLVLASGKPLAAAVRGIAPDGVEFCVEATGVPEVVRAAVDSLQRGGECALLGIGHAAQEIAFNHMQVAFTGVGIRGYPSGMSEPDVEIPRLMALHRTGQLPVERLITRFPFHHINDAVDAAINGSAIKPILVFD